MKNLSNSCLILNNGPDTSFLHVDNTCLKIDMFDVGCRRYYYGLNGKFRFTPFCGKLPSNLVVCDLQLPFLHLMVIVYFLACVNCFGWVLGV